MICTDLKDFCPERGTLKYNYLEGAELLPLSTRQLKNLKKHNFEQFGQDLNKLKKPKKLLNTMENQKNI